MTQEIIEAVRDIEREKGIESGTLIDALQDGLLAAYKKTPGAARHAVVELDDAGDFRVYAVQLPPARVLVEGAIIAGIAIALLEIGWRFSRVIGSRRSFGEVADADPTDEERLATANPSA